MGEVAKPMVVLVADDDEDDRVFTRDALLEIGAGTVNFVHDGEELLDYLRRQGRHAERSERDDPDVVLLDLNMPRMTGAEALSEIRADMNLRTLPVVVLTTSTSEADVVDSYALGANSFISKPSTFAGLVETLRTFRAYWTNVVSLPNC